MYFIYYIVRLAEKQMTITDVFAIKSSWFI